MTIWKETFRFSSLARFAILAAWKSRSSLSKGRLPTFIVPGGEHLTGIGPAGGEGNIHNAGFHAAAHTQCDVAIAQYAMALLMNICHNVTVQSDYTKTGYWKEKETNPQASYNQLFVPQIELYQKTMGIIIDEEALLEALESRKVYMAGLDVVANEPPQYQIPLMQSPYTFITSHIAWQPKAARLRAVDLAVKNFRSYLEGMPTSVIN